MAPRPAPAQTTHRPIEHTFPAWGVDVFESHHAEDWRMEATAHDFVKVIFVLQGAGSLHSNGRVVPCSQGDVIVVPIGQEHRLEDRPRHPMSLYVVSIRPRVCEAAALDPALLPEGRLELNPLISSKVEGTMRRLLFEQTLDQCNSGAMVVSLALRLLAELMRLGDRRAAESANDGAGVPRQRPTDTMTRMRTYIADLDDHFFEASNLDSAAMSLGISRRRFTQLFREMTGTSWLAYVRRLRVEHAKRLLRQTQRTVLAIAFECGFEDLSTFYRAFKREVGESPNQWRSKERERQEE